MASKETWGVVAGSMVTNLELLSPTVRISGLNEGASVAEIANTRPAWATVNEPVASTHK